MIRMACPRCKALQQFGDDCAGKTVPCPGCRQPVAVPPLTPVAPAVAVRAVPAQQPVSYTVPVKQQAPDFVMPAGARMNPLLLAGLGLAVVLMGIMYLLTFLPDKEKPISPGTGPAEARGKKKELPYTRDPAEVVKDLKSEDPGVVLQAAKELEVRGVGGKAALNLLGGIVKDTTRNDNVHLQTRRAAALAIGKIGSEETEEVRQNLAATLQGALNDPDEPMRYAAVDGLGKLGKPGVASLLPVLDRFAADKRYAMRAGEVLATMGADAQPAIPQFQRMMGNTPQIHDAVKLCSYIVQIDPRGPGTGGVLNQALRYNDEGVRRHALVLITKMGNSARGLAGTLDYVASNDINAELRQMARTALDKMNQN